MGAAASSLPSWMDDDELKRICGKEYERHRKTLQLFKNERGVVDTIEFLKYFADKHEREVWRIFERYGTDGHLNCESFVKLCREAKILNKVNFSARRAEAFFTAFSSMVLSQTINYHQFRVELLPSTAEEIGMSLQDLILRIAYIDADDQETTTTSVSLEDTEKFMKNVPGVKGKGAKAIFRTVVKLQSFHRRVQASRRVTEMQLDRRVSMSEVDPSADLLVIPRDGHQDTVLQASFAKFSTLDEMDAAAFVKMCRSAKILNKKFTSSAVRLVFNRAKAICQAPGCRREYQEGLFLDKKINYTVFRGVLIPLLADRDPNSIESVILALSKDNLPQPAS
mmetsp:Transcript_12357/g.18738  ORF Transcript_12357/g.18738 Transcript_12357/m.18738 type:complete len:338 (-) Transcript_12357:214-1227(-)